MENKEKIYKHCAFSKTSRIIGDYWNILIIKQLLKGPKRFNEILTTIEGTTNATLSTKLKQLIKEGIIERKQFECIPLKVEYSLTLKGMKFQKIIIELESLSDGL